MWQPTIAAFNVVLVMFCFLGVASASEPIVEPFGPELTATLQARTDQADSTGVDRAIAHLANGAYQFSVPADFNGGIFGTETPVENAVFFVAKQETGGEVSGRFFYIQAFDGQMFTFTGVVTCFEVYDTPVLDRTPDVPPLRDNRAKWGGLIEQSSLPSLEGLYIWFQSIDNGNGSQWVDVSTLGGIGDDVANEAFCASDRVPNTNFGPHALAFGDIQVRR